MSQHDITAEVNEPNLNDLRESLAEIGYLQAAAALLSWDQQTKMPAASGQARGRQLAVLRRVIHEKLTAPALQRLVDRLEPLADSLPPESAEAGLIRVARQKLEFTTRVPSSFVARQAQHQAATFQTWIRARADDDFAAVRPGLEETVALSREYAGFFPKHDHLADPLIATQDTGLTAAETRRIFAALRPELVHLVRQIGDRPALDDGMLNNDFPREQQVAFATRMGRAFGFDFARGRWDWTHHPFAIRIASDDVRITTRGRDDRLGDGLFATLHEIGHGIYNQGAGAAGPILDGALGRPGGFSSAVHESQSRLWENLIGRSLGFWHHAYPQLQQAFPGPLETIPIEAFYRAINRVSPSLIRVQADELTYNLHIIIRFELELELLEGSLDVKDLPQAWNERYQNDLGIAVPNDREGVLQDVHWFSGPVGGAFQGYALGNVLSAQLWAAACAAHPEIPGEIREGRFGVLLGWLQHNIYRHGVRYTAAELVERATGGPIDVAPLIDYLGGKYGDLYGLAPGGAT